LQAHDTIAPLSVIAPPPLERTRVVPPRSASQRIISQTLAVMALVLLCMSWRLGDAPLAGTEGHRAITAHEMVQTGRWLIPRIYGEPYLAKPPLHYWTLALSESLFGSTSEWAYRLPSVLAAAMLAAALCLTAHRWFGPPAGVVSGICFLALITLWAQTAAPTSIQSTLC
jgi:4-amino-4-deoxy-L-arabinose transferase-like glycosyltransferase